MATISVGATRAGQNAVEKAEIANAQGSALVGKITSTGTIELLFFVGVCGGVMAG